MLKLGLMLSLLKCALSKSFTQPNSKDSTLITQISQREVGEDFFKCSHDSEMGLESNGISTHEWVRVWGINTHLSKLAVALSDLDRSDRSPRPVRPVSSNKLAVGPRPVRLVG